jgi:uncharacterized protein
MVPVLPASITAVIVLSMLALVLVAARVVQPAWWTSRALRVGIFLTFAAMFVGLGLWSVGRYGGELGSVRAGAGIAYVGVLTLFPAAALMPLSALVDRRLTAERARSLPGTRSFSRRAMIRFGAGSLPAAAAITAGSGFVTARQEPTMPVVRMRFPGLHRDLEGLRILQLSDVHLGAEIGLAELDRGLARAMATHRPDLIVVTGDLADDPALILPALERITKAGARLGVLASLGNHEYLHGIELTRPRFEESAVPLLVGAGRSLRVGAATLFVGGADDPVHMAGDLAGMLTPSIERAIEDAPPGADFRLLLCHRPEGFGPASEVGFDLTLSGHTHGGQLGFLGRSLFEKLRPDIFWWGPYARAARANNKTSRLYTTSGFGHWFPFRLGCPTEMPLIVLEGGPARDAGEVRNTRMAPRTP